MRAAGSWTPRAWWWRPGGGSCSGGCRGGWVWVGGGRVSGWVGARTHTQSPLTPPTTTTTAALQAHKLPFAHEAPHCATLLEAVRQIRPTALIGVSTVAGAFSEEVLQVRACVRGERARAAWGCEGEGGVGGAGGAPADPRSLLAPSAHTLLTPPPPHPTPHTRTSGHGAAQRAPHHHAPLQPHLQGRVHLPASLRRHARRPALCLGLPLPPAPGPRHGRDPHPRPGQQCLHLPRGGARSGAVPLLLHPRRSLPGGWAGWVDQWGGGARVGSRGRHGHSSLLLLLLQRNQGHSSLLLLLLLQRNQGHSRCGCCCCFHPTPPTLRRWLPRRWRG